MLIIAVCHRMVVLSQQQHSMQYKNSSRHLTHAYMICYLFLVAEVRLTGRFYYLAALVLLIYGQISSKNIFPVKLCSLVTGMLIMYVICYAVLALLIRNLMGISTSSDHSNLLKIHSHFIVQQHLSLLANSFNHQTLTYFCCESN